MKKVVIDGQALQSGSRLGGIGRYSEQLIHSISIAAPHTTFVVLLNDRLIDGLEAALRKLSLMPTNVHSIVVSYLEFETHCDNPEDVRRKIAEVCKYAMVKSLDPDLYLNCSVIEGYVEKVVGDAYLLQQRASWANSAILYDVIPLANPKLYLNDDRLREHYMMQLNCLKRFDHLLAISEHSRVQFAEKLEYSLDQITNISGGVDHTKQVGTVTQVALPERLIEGLERDFVLFVGSFDIRKNQKGLISGFARLPEQIKRQHQLVIVGNGWPAIYKTLRDFARAEGLTEDDLIFAGKVSDIVLQSLYKSCKLFVFPSFFEGLGLPLLEAMRAGAPAICSKTSCMPEIMGCDEFLFDPYDADTIAASIERGLVDAAFREKLSIHCASRWQQFTWHATATTFLEAASCLGYQPNLSADKADWNNNAMEGFEAEASFIAAATASPAIRYYAALSLAKNLGALARFHAKSAPTVAVISSWQQKCGIATYAQNLMSEWPSESFTVFAPFVREEELLDEGSGANVTRCWTQGTDDGLAMLRDHILCSGASRVLIHFNFGFFAVSSLGDLLDTLILHGLKTYVVFHSTTDPIEWNAMQRLSYIKESLANCTVLYVHGGADVSRLKNIGLSNSVQLPHGIDVSRTALANAPRSTSRVCNGSMFRVGAFGYCLPHKGFPTLVEAFAKVRQRRPRVELLLLTGEYPADSSREEIAYLKRLIDEHKLNEAVKLETRYLDMAAVTSALATCDLIVFPYLQTSESSSAAVRTALSAMVPVAVTPLEIFDDVSECTLRLRGCSAEDIAADIIKYAQIYTEDLRAFETEQERVRAFLKNSAFYVISERLHSAMLQQEVSA